MSHWIANLGNGVAERGLSTHLEIFKSIMKYLCHNTLVNPNVCYITPIS